MAEGRHRRFGIDKHTLDAALGHHRADVREGWARLTVALVADAVTREASGLLNHGPSEVELGELRATCALDRPWRSNR